MGADKKASYSPIIGIPDGVYNFGPRCASNPVVFLSLPFSRLQHRALSLATRPTPRETSPAANAERAGA